MKAEELLTEMKEKQELMDALINTESKSEMKELSDDDLENVAGGKIEWASNGRASSIGDIKYVYKEGDRVECKRLKILDYNITYRGTIVRRTLIQDEYGYYPTYWVRYDDDGEIHVVEQKDISY